MTTYESDIKTISSSEEVVFGVLSDLNNLKNIQNQTPAINTIKDLQFDADSCSFNVEGFGKIGFRIIEREPFKTIKLVSENAPFQVNIWVQLKMVDNNQTALKLTLKVDIPMMIKMMVDKKLKEGINMIADLLVKALNKLPNS
jgi:hypothetical protein